MLQMIKTTQKVLHEIGITNVPIVTAYNKADLTTKNFPEIEGNDILYSAKDSESIKILAKFITKRVFSNYKSLNIKLPLNAGALLSYLHENGDVQKEEYTSTGILITVKLSPKDYSKFSMYKQKSE